MNKLQLVQDANGRVMVERPILGDHVYALALAAATKNTITIPIQSDGNAGTGNPTSVWVTTDCYAWMDVGSVLAVPAANIVTGAAPWLITPGVPRLMVIPTGTTQISLMSTAGGLACLEWHD